MTKRKWSDIAPKDAIDIELPHPDIQGPYNELGEECPWPWGPEQLVGAPLGQYHCPYCGGMQLAGVKHLDAGPPDENGMQEYQYREAEFASKYMIEEGLSDAEIRARIGDWWRRDESRAPDVRRPS